MTQGREHPSEDLPVRARTALERVRELATASRGEPGRSVATHRASPALVEKAFSEGWLVAAGPATTPGDADGPLAGLDVAVKDIIDVAGVPVRNGTPGALWRTPPASAPAWQRLADAGARCLGKAATHEMAWGVTTPQIAHPADPERIAGGSSGGSAACVAAGVCPVGLGTDTSGSLRIPAALCGVVGFRPTTGSVDMAGITPLAPSQDVAGPIARDLETCVVVLSVLLGRSFDLDPDRGLSGLRIGVLAAPGDLDEQTTKGYDEALHRLGARGARIVELDTSLHRSAGSISYLTMLQESAQRHAAAVRSDPGGFGPEVRDLLTSGTGLAAHVDLIRRARRELTARTADLYARHGLDALLTPTTACVAPLRSSATVLLGGRKVPVDAALTRFTAWAAVTGMPAASVPVPGTAMPVGIQVMAPPWREDVCLRVAAAVRRT